MTFNSFLELNSFHVNPIAEKIIEELIELNDKDFIIWRLFRIKKCMGRNLCAKTNRGIGSFGRI